MSRIVVSQQKPSTGYRTGFVQSGYAIAARTRKFNDDYYNEQLRDPGPGRRQPRQHAEGQRRDEEEGVQPIENAAVAREEVPKVLDVRVPFQHRRREVSNQCYGRHPRAVDEAEPRSRPPQRERPDVGTEARTDETTHGSFSRFIWTCFGGGPEADLVEGMPPEPLPQIQSSKFYDNSKNLVVSNSQKLSNEILNLIGEK